MVANIENGNAHKLDSRQRVVDDKRHPAPVPPNVCGASDSDHSRHQSKQGQEQSLSLHPLMISATL
jgi:hypothetical protein